MGKQLYVKLQTPVCEIPVTATDGGGKSNTIIVAFKRYSGIDISDQKLSEFRKCLDALIQGTPEEVDTFIRDNIVYFKNVELELANVEDYATDKTVSQVNIKDTRQAKPLEDFWGTADECLSVLVDMYLASPPWKSSLIAAQTSALANMGGMDKIKN